MLSQRAARQSLQRAFRLQRLPLSHTPPHVPLLPLAAKQGPSRILFTHPPQTLLLTNCPSRANHTLRSSKLADRSGNGQQAQWRRAQHSLSQSPSQSPAQHNWHSHSPVQAAALGQGQGLPLEAARTPPPPDARAAAAAAPPTKFRHNNSRPLSSSTSTSSSLLLSRSSSSDKIASQRSAQIARHLSSSASRSIHQTQDSPSTMASEYSVRKVGAPNTLEHRVYIEKDGVPVSAFHDVPLYADQEKGILNMVVEIPRWSNAKLEVSLLLIAHYHAIWRVWCCIS